MANCDLSIELEQGDKIYTEQDTISGIVRVRADKDVNCSDLEIRTRWATHGRGNIDSGVVETKSLFAGQWAAGEQREYRFELAVGAWPPTYHGHYLNIDHYVEARAKIPWGFDPKASAAFQVRPLRRPAEIAKKAHTIDLQGRVGVLVTLSLVSMLMLFGVGIVFAGGGMLLLIVMILGGIVGFLLLTRLVLPRWLLGNVQVQLDGDHVVPGELREGTLVIGPKKNVSINAITLELSAVERCVSGSGSTRTTHKHELHRAVEIIQAATTLQTNREHRFPLVVKLPDDAPYSLDLGNNDLIWNATVEIDIPRWPNWRSNLPIQVVPAGDPGHSQRAGAVDVVVEGGVDSRRYVDPVTPTTAGSATSEGDVTFAETVGHLHALRENQAQVAVLAEAVAGLSFDIQARIERRLLYAGEDDPGVYRGGCAIWAHYPDPKLPLVLYAPREMADDFEQIGREPWQGRGTILGWDDRHGRLQIKVLLSPESRS